jgi:hypothetical protein
MDMNPPMPHDEYCRAIEAYLCRKNEGHLIRIVGPAFDAVCGWGEQGIPLKVVYRGIDRYLERYYAKSQRRRPVRVEFCEADVLDVFDDWRRAVGVLQVRESSAGAAEEGEDARQRRSLKAHLERTLARLGALRGGVEPLQEVLASTEQSLSEMVSAGTLRGDARQMVIERLRSLDATLLASARACCDEVTMAALMNEAEEELASFRPRMTEAAYKQSLDACITSLIRERLRLPGLSFD